MKEASDITSISSFISYFSTPSLIRDSISTTVLSYPFAPAACNSGKTSVLSIATLSKGYPPAISYWGIVDRILVYKEDSDDFIYNIFFIFYSHIKMFPYDFSTFIKCSQCNFFFAFKSAINSAFRQRSSVHDILKGCAENSLRIE